MEFLCQAELAESVWWVFFLRVFLELKVAGAFKGLFEVY